MNKHDIAVIAFWAERVLKFVSRVSKDVSFDALPEKEEREYFQSVKTALALPEDQVDKLRSVAGKILFAQKPFVKLVKDLGGKITENKQER